MRLTLGSVISRTSHADARLSSNVRYEIVRNYTKLAEISFIYISYIFTPHIHICLDLLVYLSTYKTRKCGS